MESQTKTFKSADLLVNSATGCIRHLDGGERTLTLVGMKVMVCLIEAEGRVVSRDELRNNVWPRQEISDEVITKAISDIRSHLANLSDSKLIETMPKRGYRWRADVVRVEAAELQKVESEAAPDSRSRNDRRRRFNVASISTLKLFGLVLVLGALISLIVVKSISHFHRASQVTLAIFPSKMVDRSIPKSADNLMSIRSALVMQLARHKNIKILSRQATQQSVSLNFSNLGKHYGVRYILELDKLTSEKGLSLDVALVDARTLMIIQSQNFLLETEVKSTVSEIEHFILSVLQDF